MGRCFRRQSVRLLTVVGLTLLSACGGKPPPPPPPASAPVAVTTDGQYRGIARLVRADIRGCPRSGPRLITVTGNSLSVVYRGPRVSYPLIGTVYPDGSVRGGDGQGTVEGQISGSHMDLTVSSQFCEVRYALEHQ